MSVEPGLCRSCACSKTLETRRGTVYRLCTADGMPKYPVLPVLRCAAHVRRDSARERGAGR